MCNFLICIKSDYWSMKVWVWDMDSVSKLMTTIELSKVLLK